jgi:hypothetical protein
MCEKHRFYPVNGGQLQQILIRTPIKRIYQLA